MLYDEWIAPARAAPGGYKLFAWETVPGGAFYNSRFISRFEDRGRTLTLGEKTTTTEQVAVIPAEP